MPRMLLALAAVLAVAACSGKSSNVNSAAAGGPGAAPSAGASAAVNAPNYPDWAQAVVPPYPNASVALPTNTRTYIFDTSDDPATVLAWYKAHVTATWKEDATVAGNWNATVNGVQIALGPPEAQAGGVKTQIEIQQQ